MNETADNHALETIESVITEEPSGAAYVVKPVPIWLRVAKIAAALAVPLAFTLIEANFAKPEAPLAQVVWLPLLTLAIALWYSRKVWRTDSIKVLDAVRTRVPVANPSRKLINAALLLFVGCILVLYAERDSVDPSKYYELGWPLAAFLAYLGFLFFPQYSDTLTPAAKVEFARLQYAKTQAEQQKQSKPVEWPWLDNLVAMVWARWYARYAVGLLLFWLAYEMAQSNQKNTTIVAVVASLYGLACMKELAFWLIGFIVVGGGLYLLFGAIAGIPVSVAIIIGALIIANSRNR